VISIISVISAQLAKSKAVCLCVLAQTVTAIHRLVILLILINSDHEPKLGQLT